MIRELRRRHRFAAIGLALLLPPAYVAALAARAPSPVAAASLASPLGEPSAAATAERVTLPARPDAGLALTVTLGRAADGARVVELDSRGLPAQPDALVYWSAEPPRGESLPDAVFFLGALPDDGVRAYHLPESSAAAQGHVLVFSVAWQRVVFAQSLSAEAAP